MSTQAAEQFYEDLRHLLSATPDGVATEYTLNVYNKLRDDVAPIVGDQPLPAKLSPTPPTALADLLVMAGQIKTALHEAGRARRKKARENFRLL